MEDAIADDSSVSRDTDDNNNKIRLILFRYSSSSVDAASTRGFALDAEERVLADERFLAGLKKRKKKR